MPAQRRAGRFTYKKHCSKCFSLLTKINHKTGKLGCKPCRRAYERLNAHRWADKKRITAKAYRKKNNRAFEVYRRSWRYGITPEQFEAKLKEQNNACAICLKPRADGRLLCTDHSHQTGKVRGLLCVTCNAGLGSFKDNPALLMEAARYLVKFEDVYA